MRVDHLQSKVSPALQTPINGAFPAIVNPEVRHALIRRAVLRRPHHNRIKIRHTLQTLQCVALLTIVKPEGHRALRGGHAGGVPVDGGVVEVELALETSGAGALETVVKIEHGLAPAGHAYFSAVDGLEVEVGLAGQALGEDALLTLGVVEPGLAELSAAVAC